MKGKKNKKNSPQSFFSVIEQVSLLKKAYHVKTWDAKPRAAPREKRAECWTGYQKFFKGGKKMKFTKLFLAAVMVAAGLTMVPMEKEVSAITFFPYQTKSSYFYTFMVDKRTDSEFEYITYRTYSNGIFKTSVVKKEIEKKPEHMKYKRIRGPFVPVKN
jgi:hypothetical protein